MEAAAVDHEFEYDWLVVGSYNMDPRSEMYDTNNLIVLRETKGNVGGWLWALGIGLTALIWGLCIAGLVLGVGRMARRSGSPAVPVPA